MSVHRRASTEQQPHIQSGVWFSGGYSARAQGGPGPQGPEPGLRLHRTLVRPVLALKIKAEQTCKGGPGGWTSLPQPHYSRNTDGLAGQNRIFSSSYSYHSTPSPWGPQTPSPEAAHSTALSLFRDCPKTVSHHGPSGVPGRLWPCAQPLAATVYRCSPGAEWIRLGANNGILFTDPPAWGGARISGGSNFHSPVAIPRKRDRTTEVTQVGVEQEFTLRNLQASLPVLILSQ